MRLSDALPTAAIDTVSEFTRQNSTSTASEGFAQGPYVAEWSGNKCCVTNVNFIGIDEYIYWILIGLLLLTGG